MYSFTTLKDLVVNENFMDILKRNDIVDIDSLINFKDSSLLKKKKLRSIVRIEIEDKIFYLKRHVWPWKEGIKSIIPWVEKEDARNEWNNILLLNRLGFHTMTPVAFGEKRRFGMPCFSLTLTENIYDAERLEEYFPRHFTSPLSKEKIIEKRALIRRLAGIARDFHKKGFNHQDFYLGHFFIRQGDGEIFIIDIQRVHQRKNIRRHDMIKDLAQLAFSAKGLGIFLNSDFVRFAHEYFDKPKLDKSDKRLIKKIMAKANRIERHTVKLLERRKRQK